MDFMGCRVSTVAVKSLEIFLSYGAKIDLLNENFTLFFGSHIINGQCYYLTCFGRKKSMLQLLN